jgi:hypothetical protein
VHFVISAVEVIDTRAAAVNALAACRTEKFSKKATPQDRFYGHFAMGS